MPVGCVEIENQPLPLGVIDSLRRMGLIGPGETPGGMPLAGGVSSDIWRVNLASGPVCVKSALPKLKVAADWCVPIERNAYEIRWLRTVSGILPNAVPHLRGCDEDTHRFAMDYLDPSQFPVWKDQLSRAEVNVDVARAVGKSLAAIHSATASVASVQHDFASDAIFRFIRLEPYFRATAQVHPDPSFRAKGTH